MFSLSFFFCVNPFRDCDIVEYIFGLFLLFLVCNCENSWKLHSDVFLFDNKLTGAWQPLGSLRMGALVTGKTKTGPEG